MLVVWLADRVTVTVSDRDSHGQALTAERDLNSRTGPRLQDGTQTAGWDLNSRTGPRQQDGT